MNSTLSCDLGLDYKLLAMRFDHGALNSASSASLAGRRNLAVTKVRERVAPVARLAVVRCA